MTPADFRNHGHALVEWIADYLTGSERYPVRLACHPATFAAHCRPRRLRGYCQVEADGRFRCPAWRVRDGIEPSILGVDRRAFRQLDSTFNGASAINCCYPALISF